MTHTAKPDYFSHFAAMLAILIESKPKDAQEPPATEALLRGIESLAHWYERQEPSEATAARAVELIRTLAYRYDSFWDQFFAVANQDSPIAQAAKLAIDAGTPITSYKQVDEILKNLP